MLAAEVDKHLDEKAQKLTTEEQAPHPDDAARWRHCVQHGFPKCGRQIHPTAGEPFWYLGELNDEPTRYSTPEEAVDAHRASTKSVSQAAGQEVA